jgi:peptidoglycan/xylan/chitin deacetylase (PgdA/CDA1 family)
MSEKKLLLITFDYELFLGERSGIVKECLIDPTDKLLACLGKYAFKALFFIDTVYILRLKEMAEKHRVARADLEAITNQLIQLVNNGHEIHPHIHPHWMDAIYDPESNEWNLREKRHYTFASVSEDKRAALFDESVSLLKSVLEMADRIQPIDSYRAGGWSIQPFENFRSLFLQFGIKHEWSVIPGKYQFSDAHGFDFREAPIVRRVYRFDTDPCHSNTNGPFTEWTISSITMNRFEKWIDFKVSGLLQRLGKRAAFKGRTVSSVISEQGDNRIRKNQKRIIASFEGLNPFTLKKYLSAIRKARYFQFISHPKLISPYEFMMIEKLFGILKRRNDIKTDFREAIPE